MPKSLICSCIPALLMRHTASSNEAQYRVTLACSIPKVGLKVQELQAHQTVVGKSTVVNTDAQHRLSCNVNNL